MDGRVRGRRRSSAIALAIPAVRHLREMPPPALPRDAPRHRHARHRPTRGRLRSRPTAARSSSSPRVTARPRLWLRSLATTTAQPLAGTEGATYPFWSPDSRSIGFFAGSALKRLDLGGGAPQTLAPVTSGRGGTWNADGVIVFAPSHESPLMRVSATGGAAAAVTTLGPQQSAPPSRRTFCPTAARFLFFATGRAGRGRDLPGRARRERPDTADARRRQRGVSARRAWARRIVARRRVAAVGAGGRRWWPSGWMWRRPRSPASR